MILQKSAFHYNLYTPISCYHLPGSSLPALQHSTSLHATSCHLPRLSIRGFRPICLPPRFSPNLPPPAVSVQFVHHLPFIVVTVPGVHHLLSLIQCSFHVFKTSFPIPLTFFSLPPTPGLVHLQRCSLPPPFLHYPCSFLFMFHHYNNFSLSLNLISIAAVTLINLARVFSK